MRRIWKCKCGEVLTDKVWHERTITGRETWSGYCIYCHHICVYYYVDTPFEQHLLIDYSPYFEAKEKYREKHKGKLA